MSCCLHLWEMIGNFENQFEGDCMLMISKYPKTEMSAISNQLSYQVLWIPPRASPCWITEPWICGGFHSLFATNCLDHIGTSSERLMEGIFTKSALHRSGLSWKTDWKVMLWDFKLSVGQMNWRHHILTKCKNKSMKHWADLKEPHSREQRHFLKSHPATPTVNVRGISKIDTDPQTASSTLVTVARKDPHLKCSLIMLLSVLLFFIIMMIYCLTKQAVNQ